jgi:hypothetical protein
MRAMQASVPEARPSIRNGAPAASPRFHPAGWLLAAALGMGVAWAAWSMREPATPATSRGASPLTLTPTQQHLGKIRQFETKAFTVQVKNTSTKTVEITGIEKSCGCTEVKADQTTLKPGETATLTGSLAAQDRLGEFGSTLRVNLSEGSYAQAQVGGKAVNVLQGPSHLDLGSLFIDEKPATQTFTFKKGEDDVPWDTLRVKASEDGSPQPNVQINRVGNTWTLSVTPPQGQEIGVYRRELILECWKNGAKEPAATLPLTAMWKT